MNILKNSGFPITPVPTMEQAALSEIPLIIRETMAQRQVLA